jgi:hypothetical protein
LGKINSSLAGVFDISFLYTVIYAPVYEELVFRELPVGIEETFHIVVEWIGNYFSARDSAVSVMKKLITLFFMLLSSLLFGVVHTSNGYSNLDTFFQVSNCLVMGLLFYTLRKKFGRGASIIAHVLNNFLAFNSSLPFGLLVLLLVETIAGVRKILPSEVVYKLELFRKDINIVFKTFKDKVDSELESVWEGKMDLYGNRLDFEDEAIEQEVTIGDSFGISDEEAIMMEEGSRKIMNLLREMPTGGTPKKRKTKKRYTKKYLKQRVRISLLKS